MTGDFTSVPLRPSDPWTGARLQQGRVLVDGDWNLNLDAAARERQHLALEAIGPAGVPDGSTGFEISFATDGTLNIGAGSMWVGGLHAVNPAVLAYSAQEAIDGPPGSGSALVYLDAFVEEVQAAEDPGELLDPALDGVDTTTRTRVAWRVRAVSVDAATCGDAAGALPANLISSGRLDITRTTPTTTVDPCAPPDDPRGKLPDGLLRVEVLDAGTETTARFAWSYENGAAAVAATQVAGNAVTLALSPSTAFVQDDLVEVSTLQRRADRHDAGPLFSIAGPGTGGGVVKLSSPSAITGTPAGLCLRRWDGQVVGAASPVPATLAGADVGVAFTARPGSYLAGDWWAARVRGNSTDAVQALTNAPPDGTRHYVASLAVVDLTAKAVLSDCRPRFPSLTAIKSGTCSVDVGPPDVADGASLQALLASYANLGPVTVRLDPGTYTLPEPLVLGPELSGITLESCREGVVLRAPDEPGPEFTAGLIVILGASSVTIRGIELGVPLTGFSPPPDAFSGRPPANQQLLGTFSTGLQVALGISADASVHLTIEDCTFDFPDPGQANVFGAGIYGTGRMDGAAVTGCTFRSASPPQTVPFNDLAVGNQVDPPYQLTFGYLQLPISRPASPGATAQLLHDARIDRCRFLGVTVPALLMTRLGSLRIDQNLVRGCYGGFWFVSIDPVQVNLFDNWAVGDPTQYLSWAQTGITPLVDRIFVIAAAIAQALALAPKDGGPIGRPPGGPIGRPPGGPIGRPPGGPIGRPPGGPIGRPPGGPIGRPGVEGPGVPSRAAEVETNVPLRLDFSDCQVDAVISDSYSGAGLLVADIVQNMGSVMMHGSQIRNRFPAGDTALVFALAEACITGNILANEIVAPRRPTFTNPDSFSMVLSPAATSLGVTAVAVTGNVFIDSTRLPARPDTIPSVLADWNLLNTVIPYRVPPVVTGVSPAVGVAGGGTIVTITGSGFTGATGVQFGTAVTAATVVSDTQIITTSPPGSGTVDVIVTTPARTSPASAADQFTYTGVVPVITGLAPTAGTTAGGINVTITGSGFTGATGVQFGTASAAFAVVSDTQITATSPPGSGTAHVTVTTATGTSSQGAADQFTYTVAPPVVAGISPNGGPAGGGTGVTITGRGFTGATSMRFGTASAAFTVVSDTQITATSPPGSGTVHVSVITPAGSSAQGAADQFAYAAPAPVVTGVLPRGGTTDGGTPVTITGSGFTGASAVRFGASAAVSSAAASFTVHSSTQITADTPPRAAGTVHVIVITPAGSSALNLASQFTFVKEKEKEKEGKEVLAVERLPQALAPAPGMAPAADAPDGDQQAFIAPEERPDAGPDLPDDDSDG